MKYFFIVTMMVMASALLSVSAQAIDGSLDEAIVSAVKKSYVFKKYLKGDDIKIESQGGVVTLKGVVLSDINKRMAENVLKESNGVTAVHNLLKVKTKIDDEKPNAALNARVKYVLLFHRNVNGMKTEVMVEDGLVTLRGRAISLAQKRLTGRYTKDVVGVTDVTNKMTITRTRKMQDPKALIVKMDNARESVDDASITTFVKMILLYHRSTRDLKAQVNTIGGVVYLEGNVKNNVDKKLTTHILKDVRGVKRVRNNLILL